MVVLEDEQKRFVVVMVAVFSLFKVLPVETFFFLPGGALRGFEAGKPQCSSRGRPGFRGTLWVASRVPSALSTSNS